MSQFVLFLEALVLVAAIFGCAVRMFDGNGSAAAWAAITAMQTVKLIVAYSAKGKRA